MAKVNPKIKSEINFLYSTNCSIYGIAKILNLSYSTIYRHTRLLEKINPKTGQKFKSSLEYEKYIVKKKNKKDNEYQKKKVLDRHNPETGTNYTSRHEYNDYMARQKIDPETGEKYKSLREYRTSNKKRLQEKRKKAMKQSNANLIDIVNNN